MPASLPSCLNVASHLDPRFGGIVTSLPPLCRAIEDQARYQSSLAAFCLAEEAVSQEQASGVYRFPHDRSSWLLNPHLRKQFDALTREAALLHVHGLWEAHCAIGASAARRARRPYVISAHGMLDPWALKQKSWKKTVYSQLVERRNLGSAACLRAMTLNEAEQYRDFGLKNPIAVIPNGVKIPANLSADLFLDHFPEARGRAIVLFLGRIHPKKGLFELCRTWREVRSRFPESHLVIAGPDFAGTESGLRRVVAEQAIQDSVTFTGMLKGPLKWSAYASATVFTLPSHSEGFSVSVLEALGSGTPVLITDACYFPDVQKAKAGWTIGSATEDEILAALTSALELPVPCIRMLGANGAKLVAEKYSWAKIASQFADLYDWLLGGPAPASCPIWAELN